MVVAATVVCALRCRESDLHGEGVLLALWPVCTLAHRGRGFVGPDYPIGLATPRLAGGARSSMRLAPNESAARNLVYDTASGRPQ